jgi:Mrp family chromosome partitioning ATPase
VLIDSAPLQLVSDAQVLSQFASSVIYVVKADATPYQVAQNGLKKLRRVKRPDPRRRAEPARPGKGREVLR